MDRWAMKKQKRVDAFRVEYEKTTLSIGQIQPQIPFDAFAYNYPQGRITDHRIGLTLFSLDSFLNGNIGAMIDALITADTAEKLKASEN